MPLGRAGVRHGLDDVVLDGKGLAETLGDSADLKVAFEHSETLHHWERRCNARASDWHRNGTLAPMKTTAFDMLVDSDRTTFDVKTAGAGPSGRLPLTAQ